MKWEAEPECLQLCELCSNYLKLPYRWLDFAFVHIGGFETVTVTVVRNHEKMNWQQAGWIIKLQLVAINFQFLTDSGHHGKNMSAPLKEHYLHNQPFFFCMSHSRMRKEDWKSPRKRLRNHDVKWGWVFGFRYCISRGDMWKAVPWRVTVRICLKYGI